MKIEYGKNMSFLINPRCRPFLHRYFVTVKHAWRRP